MTPKRWRRIDELFDAALLLGPAERAAWLRDGSGGDADLRREVGRLLAQDERAEGEGFLTPPEVTDRAAEETNSWHSHGKRRPLRGPEPIAHAEAGSVAGASGFSPKAAIAPGPQPQPVSEAASLVRARLRELPMIYILFLAMATFYRNVILGDDDPLISLLDVTATALLAGLIALLSSRSSVSLAWLKALELGAIGIVAIRNTVVEYRVVLMFSLRGDPMMAQLTVKNLVLLTCILILTYGLYVPKSTRRAALVTVPLALLPFATLLVLYVKHPDAMGWLGRGWRLSPTPRLLLLSFDAMTLVIVAIGSAIGARAISRLRRQVAEARQLGQYRLRQRIGGGGMGEVYLAEHQLLKRPCALKLIRPDAAIEPKALARFEREVQLTATLSHPNTIEIFDYGRTEDGSYFYVMEYLPGLNLSELVKQHGPLPPARAVHILRQVCLALGEAHAAGLIHRDIKPSNIFAARRGGMDDVAKLLDFGLVRPAAAITAPHLSEEGQILGTPLFMSPEQATGRQNLDERSDIYSLGAVAYYLLTGRPPFDLGDRISVMIAHARDPVVPPSQVRAGIPEDLEHVVLRCLAKNAADRFPDAASLERALGECGCARDWDQEHAAGWWREARQIHART
jgi:eukaryotic-like serine/threonine-protein kinase